MATLVERLPELSASVLSDVLYGGAPRDQVFAANPRLERIRRLR